MATGFSTPFCKANNSHQATICSLPGSTTRTPAVERYPETGHRQLTECGSQQAQSHQRSRRESTDGVDQGNHHSRAQKAGMTIRFMATRCRQSHCAKNAGVSAIAGRWQ